MNAPFILPRHKLTVDDYHAMGKAGILDEDSRIELIEGELIDMAPIGSLHSSKVAKLHQLLFQKISAETALVFSQNPLHLSPHNEPQPDLMLLKPRSDWYEHSLPIPLDVLLLIEVADTTIERDRQIKCPLYAKYGIIETWLVNVSQQTLEIYQEPQEDGYAKILRRKKGDSVSPLQLSEISIALSDLWSD